MTLETKIARLEKRIGALEDTNVHLIRWIMVHAPLIPRSAPPTLVHQEDDTTRTIRNLRDRMV